MNAHPLDLLFHHVIATLPAEPKRQRELIEALSGAIGHNHPCRKQVAELLNHVRAVERRDRAQLALNDEFAKLLTGGRK